MKCFYYYLSFLQQLPVCRTDPLEFSQTGACLSDHVHRFYGAVSDKTMRPEVRSKWGSNYYIKALWRSALKTWGLPQETQAMWRRTNHCIGTLWFTKSPTQAAAPRLIRWWMSGLPQLTTSGELARLKHFQLVSKWEPVALTNWPGWEKCVTHLLHVRGRMMEAAVSWLDQTSSFQRQDVEVIRQQNWKRTILSFSSRARDQHQVPNVLGRSEGGVRLRWPRDVRPRVWRRWAQWVFWVHLSLLPPSEDAGDTSLCQGPGLWGQWSRSWPKVTSDCLGRSSHLLWWLRHISQWLLFWLEWNRAAESPG